MATRLLITRGGQRVGRTAALRSSLEIEHDKIVVEAADYGITKVRGQATGNEPNLPEFKRLLKILEYAKKNPEKFRGIFA